ncbi:MAG: DNA-3-methyladenine glycosylase 2 family protein [Saprospiraceae bacterium]|nr:DNA-3-methyladenine glycosylase 2 family protein [Saprospiraceae bacterium]
MIKPEIISHLQKDPVLHSLISDVPLHIEKPDLTLFEQLMRSIISQQLSTKAASTIYGRFRNGFDSFPLQPDDVLQKDTETLRSYGLSYQKASYLHHIAEHFKTNKLVDHPWDHHDDASVIKTLLPIKGVGLWTVQMVLIFHLLREDVFPIDDLAIRQRMISWYQPEGEGKIQISNLHRIAENWRPYRSIACRYIWAAGDLEKQRKTV